MAGNRPRETAKHGRNEQMIGAIQQIPDGASRD
jgi:hypothetical protein